MSRGKSYTASNNNTRTFDCGECVCVCVVRTARAPWSEIRNTTRKNLCRSNLFYLFGFPTPFFQLDSLLHVGFDVRRGGGGSYEKRARNGSRNLNAHVEKRRRSGERTGGYARGKTVHTTRSRKVYTENLDVASDFRIGREGWFTGVFLMLWK